MREAERFCADIAKQTEAGADILNRLTRIATARANLKGEASPLPPMKPAAPDPKAIMAAAAAFTERAKARDMARDKDRAA